MRPERDNIAAPDLPDEIVWVGEQPQSMPALTAAGPVLVHFFDFSQLNSVRTLPYLVEWDSRYREGGLTTLGVQAPRFPFGSDANRVAAGLADLDVTFPVAIDVERELWLAYGCEGWPSLFLWTTGGALSWFHFGEGEYLGTEMAIQEELRELDALRTLPEPMRPLRPSDSPGAKVMPPTPEVFPGGSWEQSWTNGELELDYEAGSAHATVEGTGALTVIIDGADTQQLEIDGPRLYTLAEHQRHESHRLTLEPSPGLRIWSVSFAAGVP
jgi:Thioredoxin like C-terminal domain